MDEKFQDLPTWAFEIDEVSAGVYRVRGKDSVSGANVDLKGENPELLLRDARNAANEMDRPARSREMATSLKSRTFQLWEYRVGHGSLLIRSPKSLEGPRANLDLTCVGVEYLAAPRHLRGLELVEPTPAEVAQLSTLLRRPIPASNVHILASEGSRFPVVATSVQISENEGDIFDSPFQFPCSGA